MDDPYDWSILESATYNVEGALASSFREDMLVSQQYTGLRSLIQSEGMLVVWLRYPTITLLSTRRFVGQEKLAESKSQRGGKITCFPPVNIASPNPLKSALTRTSFKSIWVSEIVILYDILLEI